MTFVGSSKTDVFIFRAWQESNLKNKEREDCFHLQISETPWHVVIVINVALNYQDDNDSMAVTYMAFIYFYPPNLLPFLFRVSMATAISDSAAGVFCARTS